MELHCVHHSSSSSSSSSGETTMHDEACLELFQLWMQLLGGQVPQGSMQQHAAAKDRC